MSNSTEALISRAATFGDYPNPVAYDSSHSMSYGYWICNKCTSSFYAGGEPLHEKTCPIKTGTPGLFTYESPDMIYVLGDKEKGSFSPFKKEDIEKIKAFAKSRL